ncbi:uncharacterized protein LOC141538298 [Cotesia typhae]|uniref:uncharacterized protein LOC141538298 n=1 Tax=Cotesia typhae TaxID=2053667 RepID=UPI003D6848E0
MTTITKYGLTIKHRDDLIYIYQFEEPDSNGREYEPYTVRYLPDFKVLESDVKKTVDFEDSFETKITRRINTSDLNSKKLVLIGFKNGRVIVKQISTSFEEDQNVSSDYKNLQIITADRNTILVQSSKIPKRNEIQIRHDNGKIFVWQGSDQILELNIDRPDIGDGDLDIDDPSRDYKGVVNSNASSDDEVSDSNKPRSGTSSNSKLPATGIPVANNIRRLYHILNDDSDGRVILSIYEKKRKLIPKARNRLTRFVIKFERDKAIENLEPRGQLLIFMISSTRFIFLSNEIAKTFPGERAATYYTLYESVDDYEINASGKLWHHYNYIKSKLKESGFLINLRAPVHPLPLDVNIVEQLNTLRTKVEPWCTVLELWQRTFESRRNFLIK